MKKTAMLVLLLALCLLAAPFASAEAGPVARSDAYAAYVDGQGHLYLPGRADAINGNPADSLVGIDAYRALYLSPDGFQDTQDLYMVDLQSFEESLIATDVTAACLAGDDAAYYVSGANRKQLMRANLRDLKAEAVYTAAEPIDRLYLSAEGLIFQLVDQAATLLYDEDRDRVEVYNGDMPRSGVLGDRYETYLTDDARLCVKSTFNYNVSQVDTDVTAFARLNDTVYYITRTGTALRLKACDLSTLKTRVVLTPAVKMKDQLTASGKSLFMLASDNTVCRVDTAKGTLSVFKRYSDLSSYKLPAEYTVDGLRIEGMNGQLNVYAQLREKASKPTFSFIEFESEAEVAAPALRLLDALKLKGEKDASEQMKPAAQYSTLSRGSRGDAVSAIQQPLYDLGYYDYYIDGIFGPRTEAAVRMLQSDLDRPVTGVADAELQRIILSGTLDPYDPYLQLTRGMHGMRVRTMQERLRELGYLADAADGIFGPRTLKAVQLFQEENGLPESNAATRQTLKLLYSDRAEPCSSYIDLYPGDTGYRVRELNRRLKELYYLECSPGSTYTSATTSAVRVFQRTAGLKETGKATQAVQRLLFSDDAPEAPGFIVLRRGDDNPRVARLQRRLKELNYYHGPVDGYYGRETKEAVALFQKKVGLKSTGVATVCTQKLLFAPDAPEYVKPTVIGVPDIYVEDFDYEEDGVYYISEESTASGYVIFDWDVEGSVEYYNVRVTDSDGNVYADNDTVMTSTGVSLATLDYDVVYTLRVKAFPEDGNKKHITRAEVDFVRIDPEDDAVEAMLESVGIPEIGMDTVARLENGVNYLMPGTITFDWFAEGDVGSYNIRIEDESGDVIVDQSMSDTQATLSSSAMNAGEVYTITVEAIPEGGDVKMARSNSAQFALPDIELPEPDPTPEPTPEPEPDPTPEPEPTEEPEQDEAPEPPEEPVATFEPAEEPAVENPAEDQNEQEGQAPDSETDTPSGQTDSGEAPVAEGEPLVVPEPATELEPEVESEPETEPEPEVEPEAEPEPEVEPEPEEAPEGSAVSEPVIALDYVQEEANDIAYISGDVLTITWQTEGDVAGYHVELLDSAGNVLDSRDVESTTLSAHTNAFDPSEVYTLNVTAIPAGGTQADGATASAVFAVYAAPAEAPENREAGEAVAEPDDEWQNADEEWQDAEEEYQEPVDNHQEPDEDHQEPEEEYQEPEEEYQEPEEEYQEPEEEYQEPEEEYQEPEEEYQEPEEEYQESEEEYQEPEEEYQESEGDGEPGDLKAVELTEETLNAIQEALVSLGWLSPDTYMPGMLDEATVSAIGSFQQYCNEAFALELPVIDPENPTVDGDTMNMLTLADASYANPNA